MSTSAALQFHEAADEFPLLPKDRLDALTEDIRTHGLREPIVLCDGKILDGRNRYLACNAACIQPRFEEFPASLDPFAYVWSLNGERRDLNGDQRYLIWKSVHEKSSAWSARQRAIQEEANRKRSEAAAGNQNAAKRTGGNLFQENSRATICGTTVLTTPAKKQPQRSTDAKAKASKTNRGAVERMDRLEENRPDLAKQVKTGDLRPVEAMRQMRRDSVREKVSALPEGIYRILYADPPWKYGDDMEGIESHYGPAERHYPTMALADICALPVREHVADDAVLFLWVTSPLLFDAAQVFKAWGFEYRACFVWDKVKHNMGRYNSVRHEFLLVCVRGSCTPDVSRLFDSVQSIERTNRHSEKPEEFRQIIDTIYPHGPRLELFARRDVPENWKKWGPES